MRYFSVIFTLMFATGVHAETITVSAAISLKESLTEIAKAYQSSSGDQVVFNFDASGKLAMQIVQGAPVDAFVSADQEQMDKLEKAGKIKAGTRRVVVRNTLVLIIPTGEKNPPTGFNDLLNDHALKIAIGEPKSVPAGHYAMQVLQALKMDQTLSSKLVFGESVRQVLTYVEQGEVYAGIVYGSDARLAKDKVTVITTADPSTHDAIEYPTALVANSSHAQSASRFLDYLQTRPAQSILANHGFITESPTTRPGQ